MPVGAWRQAGGCPDMKRMLPPSHPEMPYQVDGAKDDVPAAKEMHHVMETLSRQLHAERSARLDLERQHAVLKAMLTWVPAAIWCTMHTHTHTHMHACAHQLMHARTRTRCMQKNRGNLCSCHKGGRNVHVNVKGRPFPSWEGEMDRSVAGNPMFPQFFTFHPLNITGKFRGCQPAAPPEIHTIHANFVAESKPV
eukprot:351612-Chlamydomonas_euryale.AAC.8